MRHSSSKSVAGAKSESGYRFGSRSGSWLGSWSWPRSRSESESGYRSILVKE